jgi:tRNA uracil 4-sulfurtransferase
VRIQVRLFSLFRERAGTAQAPLELDAGATVGDALARLGQAYPGLQDFLAGRDLPVLVSRNREYARSGDPLREGDELALFPPVSGGTGSRGILLLSGGFDSPVAGSWALEQGHALDAVHFSMEPFTDDASVRKATQLARLLGLPRLTVVRLGPALSEVAKATDPRCYFVLQKRLMYRIAERLASRTGGAFLLTGENLGQVSSQTLPNLGAIDAVAGLPVVRPLLGLDKTDIISAARRMGTYETSKGPEVCDVLGPKHPSTAVPLERVLREEAKIDVGRLVDEALAGALDVDPSVETLAPGPAGVAC